MSVRTLCVLLTFCACGRDIVSEAPGTSVCGQGTVFEEGRCVGLITCGPGTHREGAQCFADTASLTCGAGTVEQAGVCVALLQCGAGTSQQGSQCVAVGSVTCGAGTTLQGTQCVAAPAVTCGAGTILQGSTCVGTGWYEVRIGSTIIPADGYSKIPVLALGRLPDGRPATDAVVLSLNRTNAGTIQMPGLRLGELGANTWYTPCTSAGNPLCLGPARLEMRLGTNVTQVVAVSQEFTLQNPLGVGTTAPCDSHANALFFDGTGYIFTGTQLVTSGTFTASATSSSVVAIHVTPAQSSQGLWWDLDFAAPSGSGALVVQVYPMAERYPFQSPGNAGLDVTGDGRGCNVSSGRFQVHRLSMSNGQLTDFVATFEQFCERTPSNVLRGCVKYTR